MNDEAYWYFKNGHLGQHIIPPVDPSTTSFITVRTRDIGYKKVRAELIPCIEGNYLQSKIFISEPYETQKNFRDRIEQDIKKFLLEQRRITDWTQSRKSKRKTHSSPKRRKK